MGLDWTLQGVDGPGTNTQGIAESEWKIRKPKLITLCWMDVNNIIIVIVGVVGRVE